MQPGLDPGMTEPLKTESGKKAYIAMKILKNICGAKVTSYQVKKVLNTLYNDWGKNMPDDALEYAIYHLTYICYLYEDNYIFQNC